MGTPGPPPVGLVMPPSLPVRRYGIVTAGRPGGAEWGRAR
jgi:hypothetical protein